MKVKSLSLIHLLATPRTAAYQAPLSMGFSRQEYWSGLPVPSPAARLSKCLIQEWIFLVVQMVSNLPGMQETGLIPGLGRSPGEGNSYPLQYSCLENPMDRGDWRATIHLQFLKELPHCLPFSLFFKKKKKSNYLNRLST